MHYRSKASILAFELDEVALVVLARCACVRSQRAPLG